MNKKLFLIIPAFACVLYLWSMKEDSAQTIEKEIEQIASDLEKLGVQETPNQLSMSWGAASRQGRKPMMEDRYVAGLPLTQDKSDAFFGVYDGHIGQAAADYVMENLHEKLKPLVSFGSNDNTNQQAIKTVFEQTEKELLEKKERSGTTATISYMQTNDAGKNIIFLGWAGDSRAIIADKDNRIKFATTDHRPQNKQEAKKTTANLTRSLGNFRTKNNPTNLLHAVPDTKALAAQEGDTIIIASDGVWDAPGMDNDIVGMIVEGMMEPEEASAPGSQEQAIENGNNDQMQSLARKIRDLAYQMGSKDNIAVMAIRIEKPAADE